ncbi:response regulator [Pedobacter sp. AW31-3R]|uniref:response regulator n=1 Tax=Pedobacter sp. AW31-3R TaxID=3445781 RepID=UPI003F9FB05B
MMDGKKYLFIKNSTQLTELGFDEEKVIVFNVEETLNKTDETDHLFSSNSEEYFQHQISRAIDKKEHDGIAALIIDKDLGADGWSRAMGLAGHIIYSDFSNCNISNVPIILTDWDDITITNNSLRANAIDNLMQDKGVYFRTYQDIFPLNISEGTMRLDNIIHKFQKPKPSDFEIRIQTDQRHQATNEWGAIRLAHNLGIYDKIVFKYPQHLYFKYLLNKIAQNTPAEDVSLHGLFKSVLLIDDNASQGWEDVVKHALKATITPLENLSKVQDKQLNNIQYFKGFDLILLDLYLEAGKSNAAPSIALLRAIKEKFPHVPVIIFTASEKAVRLNECFSNGADELYIKESPNYYSDADYTAKNLVSFKRVITGVAKKYKVLKPYWTAIEEILSDANFGGIENLGQRMFKDRLQERLKMFYGLLKKGYEQYDYDKNTFFYSDYELAFITLWSTFNEIQEVAFNKILATYPLKDINGLSYNAPRSGSVVPAGFENWLYVKDNSPYLEVVVELDPNGAPMHQSVFSYKLCYASKFIKLQTRPSYSFTAPYFSINTQNTIVKDKKHYTQALFCQIAFMIEKINPADKLLYFQNLLALNKVRNGLYLTHGEDIGAGFYAKTEENKRNTSQILPDKKIKDLFDIVYLLLTENGKKIVM